MSINNFSWVGSGGQVVTLSSNPTSPITIILPSVSGSMMNGNTVSINIGNTPRLGGSFVISGQVALNVGRTVTIAQSAGPYSGKGTLADEAEMDSILVCGTVLNSSTIQAFWNSLYQVRGYFNFNVHGGY